MTRTSVATVVVLVLKNQLTNENIKDVNKKTYSWGVWATATALRSSVARSKCCCPKIKNLRKEKIKIININVLFVRSFGGGRAHREGVVA